MHILGSNIKRRRTELGLSMEELAQRAGYSHRASIWHIEAGDVDVPMKRLQRLAEALETDASELMREE